MTAYRARLGNRGRAGRPAQASSRQSLAKARRAFRIWRRTRPFWGGLVVIIGASEMLVSERAPFQVVTHIGVTGLAGYLIPAFILFCGVMLWFAPVAWIYYSVLTIVLALGSWITSNLGGFLIGMLIDIVGGALAFAWTTDTDNAPSRQIRSELPAGLSSWARELASHCEPGQLARRSRKPLDWQRVERPALPAPSRSGMADADDGRDAPDRQPAQPATQQLDVIASDQAVGEPPPSPQSR